MKVNSKLFLYIGYEHIFSFNYFKIKSRCYVIVPFDLYYFTKFLTNVYKVTKQILYNLSKNLSCQNCNQLKIPTKAKVE